MVEGTRAAEKVSQEVALTIVDCLRGIPACLRFSFMQPSGLQRDAVHEGSGCCQYITRCVFLSLQNIQGVYDTSVAVSKQPKGVILLQVCKRCLDVPLIKTSSLVIISLYKSVKSHT